LANSNDVINKGSGKEFDENGKKIFWISQQTHVIKQKLRGIAAAAPRIPTGLVELISGAVC
jgi:hypothetical protein